ncbi:hypothetical protein MetMK1DRAFT_00013290 [Metallosphaera yellowstonensis MK1]|uniref:Uncharacterized protein n=1 Tax=Metallosphaera yellowstonensis MK1 TaxID=671065 RepID=H2C3K4_9CREN|nr:hypothetical protein [Metallosphaera yellowstonensis]EHP70825.1 hypothetical protein MetMK1DRAFT_00013290 [Metallosphaera yellowstonensis MK1]
MKKLAREIASEIDRGRYLLVVPGFDSSFLSYLKDEAEDADVLLPWELGRSTEEKTEVVVSNFATPSLIAWADYVLFNTSEELMLEGYHKPFRVLQYTYDSPISWLRYSVRRVEIVASLAGEGSLVVPANFEEGRSLERKGVEVVYSLASVRRTERVILARRLRSITAYLQVRSMVLDGGMLVDVGGNSTHEEWSKVTLGELGMFPARDMNTPHSSSTELKEFKLLKKSEKLVTPRTKLPKLVIQRGKLTAGGKVIAEYKIRGGLLLLKLKCPTTTTLSTKRVHRSAFLQPASTGRCTFYYSCLNSLRERDTCKELSMRAYLHLRNHVNRVSNLNFSGIINSALKGVSMREIMMGKRITLVLDGEELPVTLRGEEGYIRVECSDCLKFKRASLRIKDLETNYAKLKRVLKDLLLKEMTTWRHR